MADSDVFLKPSDGKPAQKARDVSPADLNTRDAPSPAHTVPGGGIRDLVQQSVRESRLFLPTQPDEAELDQLAQSAADLGVTYLSSPPLPMLEQANALRSELTRRLLGGAFRLNQLSDVYLTLARVSGVLSYAALDLGDSRAAMVHGQATYRLADLAGSDEMRAWARGTQSLIARFDQNFPLAQRFLEDGMRYAGSGTSEIRLLCGMAQVAAHYGNTQRAIDLLAKARAARRYARPDSVEGLFGFSPAKQAYYSGSSLMWLPERHALRIAAEQSAIAIERWRRGPVEQRSLDDEALAHVYRATALLRLGDIDEAMNAVHPVLELPVEHRISWLGKRVTNLASILARDPRFCRSRVAASAREKLMAFAAQPLMLHLSTAYGSAGD